MSEQIVSAERPRATESIAGLCALWVLRMGIGWHFLYEGISKLLDRGWSSESYLRGSAPPLAGAFHYIADHAWLLKTVDQVNIWALVLIGLALMLGLLTRLAAFGGMVLLALYYLAYPPLFGPAVTDAADGHFLLVNRNLVELLALLVVLILPATRLGLDGIREVRRARRRAAREAEPPVVCAQEMKIDLVPFNFSRRRALAGLTGLPFVGGFVLAALKRHGWTSFEEINLISRPDAHSGATRKFDFSASLADLKGRVPVTKIGNVELSRLILGGNLIGGWAHARDLLYVSKLIKAYHHRQKVWETLRLAEACGVNTILTSPLLCDAINDYWKNANGKIQFISDCGGVGGGQALIDLVNKSVDSGACACYVQGATTDSLVAKGDFDSIEKALEQIRKRGVPAGIGAHHLRSVQACVEKGFKPDFWMKTLHHTHYWSASKKEECDNVWCDNPEETIAFMRGLTAPWIAFKTLAAGAIQAKEGFRYAFANGADFICVGMYDFQMIEDVNTAVEVLADKDKFDRQRPWMA